MIDRKKFIYYQPIYNLDMKKHLTKYTSSGLGLLLLTPMVVFAQDLNEIDTLVGALDTIVGDLIPIVFSLILLVFFWGLAKYVLNAGNSEAQDQGKNIMIGGVIALFVAASIWGIVAWMQDALGVDKTTEGTSPGVEGID